jgi:predicted transcriptional regulator
MATQRRRSARGASKNEPFVVRLDPKTKYLLELAARAQRRSASSFIEQAIVEAFGTVEVAATASQDSTLSTIGSALWDVDDADRFVNLAIRAPTLLTFDEQVRWKFVTETFRYWKGSFEDTMENRARLRRYGWLFNIALERDYSPAKIAAALAGDKALREELSALKKESEGSVATWYLDDAEELAEARAPAKRGKKV